MARRGFPRVLVLLFACVLGGCAAAPPAAPPSAAPEAGNVSEVRVFMEKIEKDFNTGDLDTFMNAFADDAVLLGSGTPDVAGKDAIRKVYADAMQTAKMELKFASAEAQVFGDLAYERGTYTLRVSDKNTGSL